MPGAVCVLAPNAGPMTLDGTNTWIVGSEEDAILVDPGPEDDEHLAAVRQVLEERSLRVRAIALTHGHPDHSEGARLFADAFSCGVRALDPEHRLGSEGLGAGDVLEAGDLRCEVVATPGHTGDSVSLLLRAPSGVGLLTGDTVLGRGTTVVAHPDGRLDDYLASLRALREHSEQVDAEWVLPGHGPALADPVGVIDYYLAHRAERLAQVAAALAQIDPALDAAEREWAVVERVYADVPQAVWPAALLSVRAQVEYLHQHG